MKLPKVDDVVAYFSEPRLRGGPPGGPFPARVVAVDKKLETLDLSVEVAPSVFKAKTGVRYADAPTKYCWSWPAPEVAT